MWQNAVNWLIYDLLGLDKSSLFGGAVNFFIYDVVKIIFLLFVIIFSVNIIRSFLPPEKIKEMLAGKNKYVGNVLAALFGIVTPFCSCSAVPLFIGFVESGIPLGATFSFLIASPVINEIALGLLWNYFGLKIALIYIVSGLLIAIFGGVVIGKLGLEDWVEDFVYQIKVGKSVSRAAKLTFKKRSKDAWIYTFGLVKKILPYIVLGVGVGAFIHGYAPEDLLVRIASKSNPFTVPAAVLIGVPLYSNAAGTIPIVVALIEKGVPMGTALAFMMAVTALSLPEMIILRKVLKKPLLATFFGIVTIAIIFTGYLFNMLI
ncbi:permease [Candidatus Oleimmundimicrobium sp.]|uniref:permease n=1 Tax=Candidatus Oleimmundimicrobium sp. TaxID=3060597 RepID=UPI002719D471|nr:permease [Candidatus Oleimmundimicrobium sp.]MDO8885619.1 permease [Candidatus Oleimmundimicrobium sp.]